MIRKMIRFVRPNTTRDFSLDERETKGYARRKMQKMRQVQVQVQVQMEDWENACKFQLYRGRVPLGRRFSITRRKQGFSGLLSRTAELSGAAV